MSLTKKPELIESSGLFQIPGLTHKTDGYSLIPYDKPLLFVA